jgi:hypothetical protein
MSTAENRARYEGSALQALMEASDHTICDRCYCCDSTVGSYSCWQCGGFEPDWADETDSGACSVCHGEGEVFHRECLGSCDDDGYHDHPLIVDPPDLPEIKPTETL